MFKVRVKFRYSYYYWTGAVISACQWEFRVQTEGNIIVVDKPDIQ